MPKNHASIAAGPSRSTPASAGGPLRSLLPGRPLAAVEHGVVLHKARGKASRLERGPRFSARRADPYDLYQRAVQEPWEDVRFLASVYRRERGREPLHLREDFCGTAMLCAQWVKSGRGRTAAGFDLDPEPLAWGLQHNFEGLGPLARRVELHLKDVREHSRRRPDVRVAFNFSYFCLRERSELVEYLRLCREDLARAGMLVLDLHGGPEACEDMEERRKVAGGFTYVWEQEWTAPVTAECMRHISFEFRDGSKLKRAFSYHWRMWTLPEVRDALSEAGFTRVDTYCEGWDEDGESGNGVFRKVRKGENCASWLAYVVALK